MSHKVKQLPPTAHLNKLFLVRNGELLSRQTLQLAGTVVRPKPDKLYQVVHVDGEKYLGHRVVWALTHGSCPVTVVIDHQDGHGLNNAPSNLRATTARGNQQNRKLARTNRSGYHGIRWRNDQARWNVQIGSGKRRKHLGTFVHLCDAIECRKTAERAEGYHPNHGRVSDGA